MNFKLIIAPNTSQTETQELATQGSNMEIVCSNGISDPRRETPGVDYERD